MKIKGRIVKGHGVASGISKESPYPTGSLEMQFPCFRERGLDLNHFYKGTLNVDISPYRWKPIKPDHYLEQINWTDLIPPESFMFFACRLIHKNRIYGGMIYFPDPKTKVQHFQREDMIEILTSRIRGIAHGDEVEIEIAEGRIRLLK